MIARTDDEARASDRRAARAYESDGRHVCSGYPVDRYCPTLIPWTRTLCRFCEGTKAVEMAHVWRTSPSIPSVGEIIRDLPLVDGFVECACGGDESAPRHEQSLTHLLYVSRTSPTGDGPR